MVDRRIAVIEQVLLMAKRTDHPHSCCKSGVSLLNALDEHGEAAPFEAVDHLGDHSRPGIREGAQSRKICDGNADTSTIRSKDNDQVERHCDQTGEYESDGVRPGGPQRASHHSEGLHAAEAEEAEGDEGETLADQLPVRGVDPRIRECRAHTSGQEQLDGGWAGNGENRPHERTDGHPDVSSNTEVAQAGIASEHTARWPLLAGLRSRQRGAVTNLG